MKDIYNKYIKKINKIYVQISYIVNCLLKFLIKYIFIYMHLKKSLWFNSI